MVLKRFMMMVALLTLVAGVAVANCGGCESDTTEASVAVGTGCGGAAKGITAQATQDGYTYTYAINNGSLEKRKGCGMVVKAVAIACPMFAGQAGLQGCGTRPAAAVPAVGGCCARPAAAAPAGCGSQGNGPKLTADADGVYLTCRGKAFAWDLDLNLVSEQTARYEERTLVDGAASLNAGPLCTMSGKLPLKLLVTDADGNADGDATVSAFLYPKDQPEGGCGVELLGTDTGIFQGLAVLSEPGVWELAFRVVRPGAADEVIYYMFEAK